MMDRMLWRVPILCGAEYAQYFRNDVICYDYCFEKFHSVKVLCPNKTKICERKNLL